MNQRSFLKTSHYPNISSEGFMFFSIFYTISIIVILLYSVVASPKQSYSLLNSNISSENVEAGALRKAQARNLDIKASAEIEVNPSTGTKPES